jgi:hypothetical protein
VVVDGRRLCSFFSSTLAETVATAVVGVVVLVREA